MKPPLPATMVTQGKRIGSGGVMRSTDRTEMKRRNTQEDNDGEGEPDELAHFTERKTDMRAHTSLRLRDRGWRMWVCAMGD